MKNFIISLLFAFSTTAHAMLVEQEIDYKAGNTTLKGFIVYDDAQKGKRPGVLVVHEWWGHNAYVRERARMLAKLGYVAFALDMYGDGKVATHPDDAKKFYNEIMQNMPLAKARFLASLKTLKNVNITDTDKIAAIGYCFGGAIVLQMAREGVNLDGVVSFHGSLSSPAPAQPGTVKAKILVAHGGTDPFIPATDITGFIDEMNKAGTDYQLEIYGEATHAFTNPNATKVGEKFGLPLKYNQQADDASWAEMQRFFARIFD